MYVCKRRELVNADEQDQWKSKDEFCRHAMSLWKEERIEETCGGE